MKKSSLDLKVTGVRGGNASWIEDKGSVVVFVDGSDYISVDAFQGRGNEYKRREECEIQIVIDSRIWKGTKDEFSVVLFGE